MSDGKKENSKHRNHRGKTRAENFSAQMNELKEMVRKELSRGAQIAEVEKKIDGKIDKIVSEVRDYERLEHMIEEKAKDAVKSVNGRLAIFSFILTITSLLGWNILVKHTTDAAISRIAGTSAHDIITAVVSNQLDQAQKDISKKVSSEITSQVPEMIAANVSDLRELSKTADENIKTMRSIVETMTVVSAARADSRKHYNQLVALANGTNNTVESNIASDAIKTIQGQYEQKYFSFDFYRPTLTKDGLQKELKDLVYIARADLAHNCSGAVADLIALNNKEFVGTLMHVVKNTKQLNTLTLAIMGIERLTGKRFRTLDSAGVLEWWKEANKNKLYHSDYEWYCDMLEKIYCHSNREQIIAAYTNTINEAHKLIKEKPDFHIASKFIIDSIIALPDYKTKIADGRKSYFEEALKHLEGTKYQDNKWHIYKTYYLALAEDSALNDFINNRLSARPEFEDELKKSGHFSEHFFNDKEIKWPSKLPPEQRKPKPQPDVWSFPLNRAQLVVHNPPPPVMPPVRSDRNLDSGNIVGYSTIEINKGLRELTEFPTNRTINPVMQKIGDLKIGVCQGDSISWNLDGEAFRFNYDGTNWVDVNSNKVEDVIIPAGVTRIRYERIKDEKTSVMFTTAF